MDTYSIWEEHMSESGHLYYFNKETGESVWADDSQWIPTSEGWQNTITGKYLEDPGDFDENYREEGATEGNPSAFLAVNDGSMATMSSTLRRSYARQKHAKMLYSEMDNGNQDRLTDHYEQNTDSLDEGISLNSSPVSHDYGGSENRKKLWKQMLQGSPLAQPRLLHSPEAYEDGSYGNNAHGIESTYTEEEAPMFALPTPNVSKETFSIRPVWKATPPPVPPSIRTISANNRDPDNAESEDNYGSFARILQQRNRRMTQSSALSQSESPYTSHNVAAAPPDDLEDTEQLPRSAFRAESRASRRKKAELVIEYARKHADFAETARAISRGRSSRSNSAKGTTPLGGSAASPSPRYHSAHKRSSTGEPSGPMRRGSAAQKLQSVLRDQYREYVEEQRQQERSREEIHAELSKAERLRIRKWVNQKNRWKHSEDSLHNRYSSASMDDSDELSSNSRRPRTAAKKTRNSRHRTSSQKEQPKTRKYLDTYDGSDLSTGVNDAASEDASSVFTSSSTYISYTSHSSVNASVSDASDTSYASNTTPVHRSRGRSQHRRRQTGRRSSMDNSNYTESTGSSSAFFSEWSDYDDTTRELAILRAAGLKLSEPASQRSRKSDDTGAKGKEKGRGRNSRRNSGRDGTEYEKHRFQKEKDSLRRKKRERKYRKRFENTGAVAPSEAGEDFRDGEHPHRTRHGKNVSLGTKRSDGRNDAEHSDFSDGGFSDASFATAEEFIGMTFNERLEWTQAQLSNVTGVVQSKLGQLAEELSQKSLPVIVATVSYLKDTSVALFGGMYSTVHKFLAPYLGEESKDESSITAAGVAAKEVITNPNKTLIDFDDVIMTDVPRSLREGRKGDAAPSHENGATGNDDSNGSTPAEAESGDSEEEEELKRMEGYVYEKENNDRTVRVVAPITALTRDAVLYTPKKSEHTDGKGSSQGAFGSPISMDGPGGVVLLESPQDSIYLMGNEKDDAIVYSPVAASFDEDHGASQPVHRVMPTVITAATATPTTHIVSAQLSASTVGLSHDGNGYVHDESIPGQEEDWSLDTAVIEPINALLNAVAIGTNEAMKLAQKQKKEEAKAKKLTLEKELIEHYGPAMKAPSKAGKTSKNAPPKEARIGDSKVIPAGSTDSLSQLKSSFDQPIDEAMQGSNEDNAAVSETVIDPMLPLSRRIEMDLAPTQWIEELPADTELGSGRTTRSKSSARNVKNPNIASGGNNETEPKQQSSPPIIGFQIVRKSKIEQPSNVIDVETSNKQDEAKDMDQVVDAYKQDMSANADNDNDTSSMGHSNKSMVQNGPVNAQAKVPSTDDESSLTRLEENTSAADEVESDHAFQEDSTIAATPAFVPEEYMPNDSPNDSPSSDIDPVVSSYEPDTNEDDNEDDNENDKEVISESERAVFEKEVDDENTSFESEAMPEQSSPKEMAREEADIDEEAVLSTDNNAHLHEDSPSENADETLSEFADTFPHGVVSTDEVDSLLAIEASEAEPSVNACATSSEIDDPPLESKLFESNTEVGLEDEGTINVEPDAESQNVKSESNIVDDASLPSPTPSNDEDMRNAVADSQKTTHAAAARRDSSSDEEDDDDDDDDDDFDDDFGDEYYDPVLFTKKQSTNIFVRDV